MTRAAITKDAIGRLGGGFMLSDEAKAAGKAAGTGGWGFYMIGRGGVLGDVDPAVLQAALVFFPHSHVAAGWTRARAAMGPAAGAQRFADVCHTWGRNRLAGVAGLDRLAALLARVADAADVAGATLFAGWRAMPLPSDPPARATQLCHVLREHRGGQHGVAVLASGLSPLDAVLAGPGGEGNAAFFGWPLPYPDVAHLSGARAAAEELTDRLVEPAWAVLDDEEFAECAKLLDAASSAAFGG